MASFLKRYRRYRVDDRNVAPASAGSGILCLSRQAPENCDVRHKSPGRAAASCAFWSSNPGGERVVSTVVT